MKHHGTINALGQKILVRQGTVDEVGDESMLSHTTHATFDVDSNTITLNTDCNVNSDQRLDNVVHEMGHAWFGLCGIRNYLRDLFPDNNEAFINKVEEAMIRMQTPAIVSSLPDLARFLPKRGPK